jgi:hypothetical protein
MSRSTNGRNCEDYAMPTWWYDRLEEERDLDFTDYLFGFINDQQERTMEIKYDNLRNYGVANITRNKRVSLEEILAIDVIITDEAVIWSIDTEQLIGYLAKLGYELNITKKKIKVLSKARPECWIKLSKKSDNTASSIMEWFYGIGEIMADIQNNAKIRGDKPISELEIYLNIRLHSEDKGGVK